MVSLQIPAVHPAVNRSSMYRDVVGIGKQMHRKRFLREAKKIV